MRSPAVELREVTKRFGSGAPVLEGLSLRVEPGEIVALLGPSGCGKSTLLRLIAGLTPTSGGTIRVGDSAPETAAERLGFVFQHPTLLPWLTVGQNVELPLKLRHLGRTERAQLRDRALAQVRLGDRTAFYPRQLSGGQQMRASLARTLATSPKVMLLDEPFGALDEMTRERLNEELLTLHQEQAWTTFFVTHSVAEAVFLAQRVLIFSANPGRVHADVSVPLPYPRTSETRLSEPYHTVVAEVSRALRETEDRSR